MELNKNVVSKVYAFFIIVLLLGVLAIQNEKVFGLDLFADQTALKQPVIFTHADICKLFPEATQSQVRNDSIIVFKKMEKIGWAYNTSPFSDAIVGFASSVPLLMGFNNQDELVGFTLLTNYESPDFVQDIESSGFMEQWNGLSVNEVANAHVDAFTGATLTSKAIIKTLKHSTAKLSNQSVSLSVSTDLKGMIKIIAGYLLVALALWQFFWPKTVKKLRTPFQMALVLILGFWMGTFLSLFSFHSWLIRGIDLPAKLFVFIILVLSIVLPLFTGKAFYCTHLCPFGASQDLVGKIRKKRVSMPMHVKQFLSTLREKVFATIMLLLFVGVSFDLTNIEPFSAFLFHSAAAPVVFLAASFLILSIFIPRSWCNYVCPTGYLLETIRKPFKK